jgi:hypothetical protein
MDAEINVLQAGLLGSCRFESCHLHQFEKTMKHLQDLRKEYESQKDYTFMTMMGKSLEEIRQISKQMCGVDFQDYINMLDREDQNLVYIGNEMDFQTWRVRKDYQI